MVVVRYEGPVGGPGMPEMLDSTSRITALCREKNIVIGLMTDGRFSGGSVGLVIGHVGPEAAIGGPIALIKDGDTITVDLNENTLVCDELTNFETVNQRKDEWVNECNKNNIIKFINKYLENENYRSDIINQTKQAIKQLSTAQTPSRLAATAILEVYNEK